MVLKRAVVAAGELEALPQEDGGLARWGHSTCTLVLNGQRFAVVFGGYGGPGTHKRLNDVLVSPLG